MKGHESRIKEIEKYIRSLEDHNVIHLNTKAESLLYDSLKMIRELKGGVNTVWSKYRVEFGTTSGLQGAYVGRTMEEVYEAIWSDNRLEDKVEIKDILRYGYFGEFIDEPYKTQDYVIDNCMHFMWTVR